MARPQSPPILTQLRSARTVPEQAAALRALKNDIVGHSQKKEQWVALGVLDPIVRTISAGRSPAKLNGKRSHNQFCTRPLSEEDGAKLQALQLVASFAHGGPAFLAPIHASDAPTHILSNISPYANSPQLVVAALRALNDIADSAVLANAESPLTIPILSDIVFAPQHIESFNAILSISSPKHQLQTQITMVCGLIHKLCCDEKKQHALALTGLLDSLAARLASFAVADGYVVPGAIDAARRDGLLDAFPEPAPENAHRASVLEAIAAIMGDSKYRAQRLVCAPAILAVFPAIKFGATRPLRDANIESGQSGLGYQTFSDSHNLDLSAMEFVLPAIPIPLSRGSSASHSSQGTPERSDSQAPSRNSHTKTIPRAQWDTSSSRLPLPADESEEVESPLIPWLVHLVRSQSDEERLMAASVLTCLYKAGLGSKAIRETSIGLLVVPLLAEMVVNNDKDQEFSIAKDEFLRRKMLEQAPLILARLILDCDTLQKAAADCNAIKTLTKLLRRAYKPIDTSIQTDMWSPYPDVHMDVEGSPPISQLGDRGQSRLLVHHIRLRESALKAVAAIAAGREEYRKALIAEDCIPYIVESLTEFPRQPRTHKDRIKEKTSESTPNTVAPEYGRNPTSVVIAGCQVVRVLSRSINALRTALVDYGVAIPIFTLLTHPDFNVQNAATATMANLVTEVSPVRELLTDRGVMRILSEHAHSDNPSLRLNALWALKHFVDAVGPELKKACLEQLETKYLLHLIKDDTQDNALSNGHTQDASDANMDEDLDVQTGEEKHIWQYGVNGDIRELDASTSTKMRQMEDRLSAIRETELNPIRKARNDDAAVQEQGLNFIRNLIGRPPVSAADNSRETSEMIDYLFKELGQDRFFDLLAAKLRPRYLNAFQRRNRVAGREARVIHPPPQIISAVIFILVHIAGSEPRHRQIVTAQTDLLKLVVQHTGRDKEVRIAFCHLVINLSTRDDENDAEGAKQRVSELTRLGFHAKLESLMRDDRELDVRERAKMASYQISESLGAPVAVSASSSVSGMSGY